MVKKKAETPDEIYVNPVKLGFALGGLSQHSIHRLSSEGVLPKPEVQGQWALFACTNAYISHLKSSAKSSDLLQARIALTNEQAESKRLENEKTRGDLVSKAETEQVWADLVMNCRNKMLALPTKMAFELSAESNPNVVLDMLTDAIYQCLTELSQLSNEDDRQP